MINEIEYRLEQSPPVVEDPEDDVFEDVETGAEVVTSWFQFLSSKQSSTFYKIIFKNNFIDFCKKKDEKCN